MTVSEASRIARRHDAMLVPEFRDGTRVAIASHGLVLREFGTDELACMAPETFEALVCALVLERA